MNNIKTYRQMLVEAESQSASERLYSAINVNSPKEAMKALEDGADPNYASEWGRTSLVNAAWHGNDEMVRLLIDNGADPDIKDIESPGMGASSLHWATEKDNVKIVKTLIDAGANVNIKDGRGNSPLYWAINKLNNVPASPELIEMLLRAGADPTQKNEWGHNCIMLAVHNNMTDQLAKFLSLSPKALRSFETEESLIKAFGGDESMVPPNVMQDWKQMKGRMQRGKSAFGM
jgi:ankyrin repeat protein